MSAGQSPVALPFVRRLRSRHLRRLGRARQWRQIRHQRRRHHRMIAQRRQKTSRRARFDNRIANRVANKIMHKCLLPKPHFRLRRMHIHIHLLRRHFQKQQYHRKRRGRNHIAVRLGQRMQNRSIANQPLIHEHIHRITIQFLQLRPRNKAVQPQRPGGCGCQSAGRFHGGGSGMPARSKLVSAATGSNWSSTSRPKI